MTKDPHHEEGMREPRIDGRDGSECVFVLWRMGRKVGRTIYAQFGENPSDDDPLIGVMDSRILAADVVASHNAVLRSRP